MPSKDKLFSRTFRGFAPDEVIAYIETLDRANKNANFESESKIRALNNRITELENELKAAEELKESISEKDKRISELEEETERLNEDNENQRKAISAQGDRTVGLEKENFDLKAELEAANVKYVALEENSKEYGNLLADVDNILASARKKAEELVSEATEKSKDIIINATSKAKEQAKAIMSESDEKLNENIKKVKYLYRRQDELAEIFKDHKAKVDSFFSSISENIDKDKTEGK